MSAHLARARLLLAQSRPVDAEREVNLALVSDPQNPGALLLLALSRVQQKKFPGALEAADQAVGLAPDVSDMHYVRALVLHHADRDDEAFAAAHEAVRLNPSDADTFSLLAGIELARRNWEKALSAAETALALNAEHVEAANFRAMALVRLGRKDEAMLTVESVLQRAPDDAVSHANQGWNCLHRNDPRRAQDHFREALRLSPDLEYARNGMLEALKARNPIYRGMLAYFLWMGRLSGRAQWAFIIGAWFGGRIVRTTLDTRPDLGWFLWPILVLYLAFIYLTWTAMTMFNLLLRLDRFGRHVLSHDQRIASNWFGTCIAGAIVSAACTYAWKSIPAFVAALACIVLSVCVSATFNRKGWPRTVLGAVTGIMACIAATSVALMFMGNRDGGLTLLSGFAIAFIGFQVTANVLQKG